MASYKKLETGWQFRVSYKDHTGQYKTKSGNGFTTKKEAQMAAAKIEDYLNKGRTLNRDKIAFKTYFEDWYKVYKEPFIAPKTKRNYVLSIKEVSRYFGETTIGEITEDKYQAFINNFADGRSKETVAKLNIHCKSVFKKAYKNGIINVNPADDVIVGGYKKPKNDVVKALSEKETELLLDELIKMLKPSQVSPYIILLSIKTGLRFSEVTALTWDCIDLENNTITINKSWDDVVTKDFQPTKNETSNRTILVDNITLSYIDQLRDYQLQTGCTFNNMVFARAGEKPPSNNSVNQSLKRTLKRAGVTTEINHHGLRHTHASSLLHHNVNIKYISKRLGHSDVSTTLNIYSHIIDEMEQKESNLVNELLLSSYNA